MFQRTTLAIGLACLICLGVGVLISRGLAPGGVEGALARGEVVTVEEFRALEKSLQDTTARLQAAREEKNETARRNKELATEVEALAKRLGELEELPSSEDEAELAKGDLPVSFGQWADLDGVKNANWPEMAEAVVSMNGLLAELVEAIENGDPIDPELQDKVRAENNKLVRYAAQIMGKIPTNSPINGEFSHPITLANLMGSMLEGAGVPYTAEQKAAIAELGNQYENEYEQLQSSYSENTPRLMKLIDELQLKRDTANGMQELLTDDQYGVVVEPAIHNRQQLDPLSPFTMAVLLSQPQRVESVDELRKGASEFISEHLQIDPAVSGSYDHIIDAWMRDLAPLLTPVEKAPAFLHLDQAVIAGRAQARALELLLALPNLDEKTRATIIGAPNWRVPQVVQKPAETDDAG